MQEIDRIWLKYEQGRILDGLESLDEVNRLAGGKRLFADARTHFFKSLDLLREFVDALVDGRQCGNWLHRRP